MNMSNLFLASALWFLALMMYTYCRAGNNPYILIISAIFGVGSVFSGGISATLYALKNGVQ